MTERETNPIPQYTGSDDINRDIVGYFEHRSPDERITELLDLYGRICDDAHYLLRKYEMRSSKIQVSTDRDFQRDYADGLSVTLRRFTEPIALGQELDTGAVAGKLIVDQIYERRNYNARFKRTDRFDTVQLRLLDASGNWISPRTDVRVSEPSVDDEIATYFSAGNMDTMNGLLQGMRHAKRRQR